MNKELETKAKKFIDAETYASAIIRDEDGRSREKDEVISSDSLVNIYHSLYPEDDEIDGDKYMELRELVNEMDIAIYPAEMIVGKY